MKFWLGFILFLFALFCVLLFVGTYVVVQRAEADCRALGGKLITGRDLDLVCVKELRKAP